MHRLRQLILRFLTLYLLVACCYLAINLLVSHMSASASSYSVQGKPTVSAALINSVLADYHSPATGTGQAIYDLGEKYGIDPAYALAFFGHESTFGNYGMARVTLSPGNIRATPGYRQIGGYRAYRSWRDGFEDWYKLICNLYVDKWGLRTVEQIVPVYAPSGDNNDVSSYISAVETFVNSWRSGEI